MPYLLKHKPTGLYYRQENSRNLHSTLCVNMSDATPYSMLRGAKVAKYNRRYIGCYGLQNVEWKEDYQLKIPVLALLSLDFDTFRSTLAFIPSSDRELLEESYGKKENCVGREYISYVYPLAYPDLCYDSSDEEKMRRDGFDIECGAYDGRRYDFWKENCPGLKKAYEDFEIIDASDIIPISSLDVWVARDKDGTISSYSVVPEKNEELGMYVAPGGIGSFMILPANAFLEVTWDSGPQKVCLMKG